MERKRNVDYMTEKRNISKRSQVRVTHLLLQTTSRQLVIILSISFALIIGTYSITRQGRSATTELSLLLLKKNCGMQKILTFNNKIAII